MSYVKVKGTYDILPEQSEKWIALEQKIRQLFARYNYHEIRTPIMEYSNVFHRENEQSDMVTKETYNFADRQGRMLTLRPEGTAGVVRSYLENKLYALSEVSKLYYIGPNFRYERPQKGRFRQFMQFGVEALGSNEPTIDAEIITLAYDVIKELGLKGVRVKINSLGDDASKQNYYQALVKHFTPHKDSLCSDCQNRLDKNPLRILDCKTDKEHSAVLNAPTPYEYLTTSAQDYFKEVLSILNTTQIPYQLAPKLVRGLDYYSQTVFEIEADIDGFGAQNALGGGGRYQSLVKELGGPEIGGIGFAFGMERLLLALEAERINLATPNTLDCYIVTFDNKYKVNALALAHLLRSHDLSCDLSFVDKQFKTQLKLALKENAKFILFLGDDEVKGEVVTVKNTTTQTQEQIPLRILARSLKEQIK